MKMFKNTTSATTKIKQTRANFDCQTVNNSEIPKQIKHWLYAQGSLTTLLEKKAGQPLRVVPHFEGYKPLTQKQKQLLGINRPQLNRPMMAWVRQSLLYGNEAQPWVQAESIFPEDSLFGNAQRLKHLGSTPIGYILYKRQKRLDSCRHLALTEQGWQRQTLYDWQGKKLLITETFLDGFL